MADRSFSSSHGNTPSRRAGAAFSGPVDLPIPEWARKTVKAQRPNLLASIQRDAAEEKDELAATSASVGARKHRGRSKTNWHVAGRGVSKLHGRGTAVSGVV